VVGDEVSPVGRTRTAPAPGHRRGPLRFLFASCQNWQQGHWPLWAHAPSEDPDLVVHLGDYIYEGGVSASAVRPHNSAEVRTLEEYRNRYGLYKGDPALQAAHAACPWVVTWDDHEVENNYAGLVPEDPAEAPAFAARRAAAYQAWWEHQPVRVPPPDGPHLRIHRAFDWGRLARFHVLDTRQYRDPQACTGSLGPTCDERTREGRTLLGAEQEAWLARSFATSRATWDVIANQVVMTSMPFGGSLYNPDQWDGYPHARRRLLQLLDEGGVVNPVVVTGDVHAAGVGDLVDELPDGSPSTGARGVELVGGSISSTFPAGLEEVAEQLIRQLPHVHFADTRRRGYMVAEASGTELVARYQVAESTLVPDSPVTTAGTWTVVAGEPGVQVRGPGLPRQLGPRPAARSRPRAVAGPAARPSRNSSSNEPRASAARLRARRSSMSCCSEGDAATPASASWRSTAPSRRATSSQRACCAATSAPPRSAKAASRWKSRARARSRARTSSSTAG